MKMKMILFGFVFLAVPLFANAAMHSAGTNVLNNGTIYMVTTDGQLRPYTSAGAFLSYGFNSWNNVEQANSDDLALPVGNFIPPRDGKVVCSDRGVDKNTCYLITNGKKAGFTSRNVFDKLGFNFKYVLYGDVSFLPATDNISDATQTHLPGTLINDAGTVKLVGTTGTVGVPSMDTLKSWGYSLIDVAPANTADKTLPQNDILTSHTPGQLAYSATTNNPTNPPPTTPTSTPAPVIPTTPIDVCPNIEGTQTVVPVGLSLVNGNCIVPSASTPTPTPTPTPPPTPTPSSTGSIDVYQDIGNNEVKNPLTTGTARKGFDHLTFAVKAFDSQGKQVDSAINVTTNDPDLPPTFSINANMAFYVGNHTPNLPQSNCSFDDHDCLPQSVGTFTFTFTQPGLNVSKSIQVTIVDYTPVAPAVTVSSGYNGGTYLVSNLNDSLSNFGLIYGNTTLFGVHPQYNSADPFIWTNIKFSITSTDFQSSDIILICGPGGGQPGAFLLSSNGDVPHGGAGIVVNGTRAYLGSCNSQAIGFGLNNIHSGSLTITVTSAKFVGQQSGNSYDATGLPLTSANIVIQ